MAEVPGGPSAARALARLSEFVRSEPLLVAGAVVAVLTLVGLAAWLRRERPPAERLRRVLADSEQVTVLMHPNPDPDAMASALAVAAIADATISGDDAVTDAGTDGAEVVDESSVPTDAPDGGDEDGPSKTTLAYPGQIRHQENRAFRTLLGVDAERVSSTAELEGDVVLVDQNRARGLNGEPVDPVAVVDHHPEEGTGSAFTDIRPDYGACATLFAEYFDDLDAAVETGDGGAADGPVLSEDLATGLMYGILTDTDELTRGCSDADFEAANYLYPAVDAETLDDVSTPAVDAEVLEVKARAIENREVRAPYAVSDVGTVDNVDAIPQAADELKRLEGVETVVVIGEYEGVLNLSARSQDVRVHVGEALETAFDGVPMADVGGHAKMAGGTIPASDGDLSLAAGVSRADLSERLFTAFTGVR
jgi:nanoRNase/pAp phosphatase (c-di-AMP/oligoRNAs hydrolase)